MNPESFAYLFLEIIALIMFFLFSSHRKVQVNGFLMKFSACLAVMVVFLTIMDVSAVHYQVWFFPSGKTLDFRFLTLPLEEHLLFYLHTIYSYMVLKVIYDE